MADESNTEERLLVRWATQNDSCVCTPDSLWATSKIQCNLGQLMRGGTGGWVSMRKAEYPRDTHYGPISRCPTCGLSFLNRAPGREEYLFAIKRLEQKLIYYQRELLSPAPYPSIAVIQLWIRRTTAALEKLQLDVHRLGL